MKAHLYIRIKQADGKRPFCEPVYAANRKLKPGYAVVNGKPEHHKEGVYHLRYLRDSKRVWEAVGSDAQEALNRLDRQDAIFNCKEVGVKVVEAAASGRSIDKAKEEYLRDVERSKSPKTYIQYEYVLRKFRAVCEKTTLDSITREDVLQFRDYFFDKGSSAYSVRNYLANLRTFFSHFDIPWPLKKTDRPRPVRKIVSAYSRGDIEAMLAVASRDEADLIQFLMCTGLRKGECLSATWANVDFTGATYKVAETADFKPKDREEGIIPIPDSLVELLRARKARYPKSHRIFEMHAANPEVYLLKAIKRLAFKAGLNCGECSFKASKAYPHGRSCATSACCRRFITHKFRKTFATLHAEAGVPVPSISRFLRHSKLDTTLAYLASGGDRSEAIRSKVNNTFADLQIKKAAA